ncbi:hypothetical protein C8F01DRAFT_1294126 [Mycena amicta]|nr:hypothetical protein C8F01DRAFT_1294126 [Mycena amicta]
MATGFWMRSERRSETGSDDVHVAVDSEIEMREGFLKRGTAHGCDGPVKGDRCDAAGIRRDRFPKYGFCTIKSQLSRPLGIVFATVETGFLNFPVDEDSSSAGLSGGCGRCLATRKSTAKLLEGRWCSIPFEAYGASQQGSPGRWMFDSAACIGWSVHVALADSRYLDGDRATGSPPNARVYVWVSQFIAWFRMAVTLVENWLHSRPSRFTIVKDPSRGINVTALTTIQGNVTLPITSSATVTFEVNPSNPPADGYTFYTARISDVYISNTIHVRVNGTAHSVWLPFLSAPGV